MAELQPCHPLKTLAMPGLLPDSHLHNSPKSLGAAPAGSAHGSLRSIRTERDAWMALRHGSPSIPPDVSNLLSPPTLTPVQHWGTPKLSGGRGGEEGCSLGWVGSEPCVPSGPSCGQDRAGGPEGRWDFG